MRRRMFHRGRDYWGAKHDAEQEWIAEAKRLAHEAGECRRGCQYCADELDEKLKAERDENG